MAPFLILVGSTTVFRLAGRLGVRPLAGWPEAARVGLVVMFLFTGATHFTGMSHDYAAMIPPPFTGSLWIISVTGVLEIAGAAGLLLPTFRRVAAMCLAVLLVALFAANVHAAINGIPFRGEPPTALWLRGPIQVIFVAALWWSSITRRRPPRR